MNDRETTIGKELANLESTIRDFKSKQYIGSHSVLTYTVTTANTWDETLVTSSFGGPMYTERTIFIYTSKNQKIPTAQLAIKADVDGVPYNPAKLQHANGDNVTVDQSFIGLVTELYRRDNVIVWEVGVSSYNVAKTFRLKAYVSATDEGTITSGGLY